MKRTIFFIFSIISLFTYGETFKLTTFNVGLAHTYVPYAEQRIPIIKDILKSNDSDVLCLQEVWRQQDRDAILNHVASEYPFSVFEEIEQQRASKKPVCRVSQLFGKDKFVTCTQKRCKDLDGDDFTSCVIEKCQDSLTRLKDRNRECAAALMSQVGKSAIKAVLAVINPFKRATMFSYGGGNGLLILSKKEIVASKTIDFSDISTLNRRQALSAKIQGVGNVLCTHLTANLVNDAPYAGQFSSWNEENYEQARRLMDHAESLEGPTFIMGDFNTGRAGFDDSYDLEIFDEMVESFNFISSYGYSNHYVQNDSGCTYCTLNELNDTRTSTQIDHIFVRGATVIESRREYTKKYLIDTGKQSLEVYASDHFGISNIISIE